MSLKNLESTEIFKSKYKHMVSCNFTPEVFFKSLDWFFLLYYNTVL